MSKQAGFYWHVHHDMLLEWCYDLEERIDYIKKLKPADEVETRLKWMQPVEGKLPKAVIEAGKAYCKAREVYRKAGETYWEACYAEEKVGEAYGKAREAYRKAWKPYCKAREPYHKALRDHKDEVEALHDKEHPDCPWDGKTLVFS